MFVKQKDKEILKRFIEVTFKNENEDVYTHIENIFGKHLAQKIDEEVFMSFYNATMKRQLHYIKYIDILETISNKYDIIFDCSYENISDCFFSDNGSIFTPDDRRYIYE